MDFHYLAGTRTVVERILADTVEFEDQIRQAGKQDDVGEVAVHPLTPGLSGAAVFLIRRIGAHGSLTPWVVKICRDPTLIITERNNYEDLVRGKLPVAPELIRAGSSRLLIFTFGGPLADYNPLPLRSGYELSSPQALAALMRRIVVSLRTLDKLSADTTPFLERMPLLGKIEDLVAPNCPLPQGVVNTLCKSWRRVRHDADKFPLIRSAAHGDLNSGNVLFEPGVDASNPVFIDFASMRRSKDNIDYPEGFHFPFWDYVKLERDIQTRLFLKEALKSGLQTDTIIEAIRTINNGGGTLQTAAEPVAKLYETIWALREAIQQQHSPEDFKAYRTVLAYGTLSVFFREQPDADVPRDLQYLVAAESSIALLTDPFSVLRRPAEREDLEKRITALQREEDTRQALACVNQEHFAKHLKDVVKSVSKGKRAMLRRPPLLWGLGTMILILLITSTVLIRSCGDKPAAQIMFPKVGEPVNPVITVSGTSKNVGSALKVWVVVKSEAGNYYSHASAAEVSASTDEWTSIGCIGPREDFEKEVEILAVVADSKAQDFLQERGQTSCADGFRILPPGATVLSSVKIYRKPRWIP